MDSETALRLEQLAKINGSLDEMEILFKTGVAKSAFEKRGELNRSCVPLDSPLRFVEVETEEMERFVRAGFDKIFGMKLVDINENSC